MQSIDNPNTWFAESRLSKKLRQRSHKALDFFTRSTCPPAPTRSSSKSSNSSGSSVSSSSHSALEKVSRLALCTNSDAFSGHESWGVRSADSEIMTGGQYQDIVVRPHEKASVDPCRVNSTGSVPSFPDQPWNYRFEVDEIAWGRGPNGYWRPVRIDGPGELERLPIGQSAIVYPVSWESEDGIEFRARLAPAIEGSLKPNNRHVRCLLERHEAPVIGGRAAVESMRELGELTGTERRNR